MINFMIVCSDCVHLFLDEVCSTLTNLAEDGKLPKATNTAICEIICKEFSFYPTKFIFGLTCTHKASTLL